jgi:hypothetical protein
MGLGSNSQGEMQNKRQPISTNPILWSRNDESYGSILAHTFYMCKKEGIGGPSLRIRTHRTSRDVGFAGSHFGKLDRRGRSSDAGQTH